jgi:hypothetical protein
MVPSITLAFSLWVLAIPFCSSANTFFSMLIVIAKSTLTIFFFLLRSPFFSFRHSD